MYPAAPRVEWTDDQHVLSCAAGRIALHALGGEVRTLAEGAFCDARRLPDGDVLAFDTTGSERRYAIDGRAIQTRSRTTEVSSAAIAGDGSRIIAASVPRELIWGLTDEHRVGLPPPEARLRILGADGSEWTLDPRAHGIQAEADRWSVGIAWDGSHVAIGYETRAWDDGRTRREAGRGWLVMSTETRQLVDRSWIAVLRDPGPTAFAFDRGAARFVAVAPERMPQIGVLRVGAAERCPRDHTGGARAVAIDDRGLLVAYVYPPGIGPQRIRVDYLAPGKRGAPVVELRDTLWIDPELDDIAALAFDPTSRRIACLSAAGALDVVPVP